jgi:hypothetical protein
MWRNWSSALDFLKSNTLTWWGNEQMVQWRDEKVLSLFK